MHPVSCTNTLHDVTDLVNHGMIECSIKWFFVPHRIERYDKGGGILITPHRHNNRTSFEKVSSFVKYWDNVFCIKSKKQKMVLFL